MAFTGVKDVDLKILMDIGDAELLGLCVTPNKYVHHICLDDDFWRNRFIKRFGQQAADHKPQNRTWKNNYMRTIIDLQRFVNDPWAFFSYILWSPKGVHFSKYKDERGEVYPFLKAPEWVMNNFYLLDLGPVTVQSVFYPTMTPAKMFERLAFSSVLNILIDGNSIFRNKELYMGNLL